MRLMRDLNIHTVKVDKGSKGLLRIRGGLSSKRSVKFMKSIGGMGTRVLCSLLRGSFLPVVYPINVSRRCGACGVGTSSTTYTVTHTVGIRGLTFLASVRNICGSPGSPSALVSRLRVGRTGRLVASKCVKNKVLPGLRGYVSTVRGNISHMRVLSKEVPRYLLLRVFAGGKVNATVLGRGRDECCSNRRWGANNEERPSPYVRSVPSYAKSQEEGMSM